MNIIEGNLKLKGDEKIAIINGRFNHIITDRLVEGAKDSFLRHGGNEENLDLILVPGAFEIPFALEKALASGFVEIPQSALKSDEDLIKWIESGA